MVNFKNKDGTKELLFFKSVIHHYRTNNDE